MKVPFAGGSYRGVSPAANAQKCVNLYVENDLNELDEQGNPKKLLVGTPGLALFSTMANASAIRGMHAFNKNDGTNWLYVVSGNTVYVLNAAGTATLVGTLLTSAVGVPVYMEDNGSGYGDQILIVDGTHAYIINTTTNVLTNVTDANLATTPTHIIQMNNWFICCGGGLNENFQLSKLGDGTTWTPLQKAAADAEFDGVVGLGKDGNKLLLFGTETVEVWWNTGNADFPFQRMGDGVYYVGCFAGNSIARAGGMICWLGNDARGKLQVFAWNNGPTVISTPSIEKQIKDCSPSAGTGGVGFGYHDRGHDFYALTLSGSGSSPATFVYDFTTEEWHQRSTGNSAGGPYNRYIAQSYVFYNGKHYVGDFNATGKVYEMTNSAFDDAGTAIYRERVGVHFNQGNDRINLRRAGFVFGGDAAKSGVGATATLQWSKDRGFNWSTARTPDKTENGLSYWEQLGQSRDWLFWLRCSSATQQCVITDAVLEPSEN